MFGNKYKKYNLIVEGDSTSSIVYYLQVYSNGKPLLFILDSGASCCLIGNTALKGCQYSNVGIKDTTIGVGGEIATRTVLFSFDLNEQESVNGNHWFCIHFSVANKKDNKLFNNGEIAGLLGANFLQFCKVDFRNGTIKVYKKPGKVTKQLMPSFNI